MALAIALALPMMLAIGPPRSVQAALTNVWPANAEGDIYPDGLTTTDALFAYVLSDLRGGRVCVIAETGAGSCEHPAMGEPNVIIGIGTVFSLIEGPELLEGTFRLRTESARPAGVEGWEEGATSDVFTIGPCGLNCDSTVGREQADAFKAASADATLLASKACDYLGTSDDEQAMATIQSGVEALGSRALGPQLIFIGGFAFGALGIEFQSYNDVAKKILMMLSCEVARMHQDIAADPPDPNFATVQPPVFSTLPAFGQPASDALAEALDRQAAVGIATRVAYERYQGAFEAGDVAAQQRQLDATGEFALQLADALRTSADALRAAVASTEPAVEGIPIHTDEALAAVKAMAQRVTTTGFTDDEVAQLRALGANDAQIVNTRTWFNRALDITPGATLDSVLLEIADGFDAAVGATDAFARHVAAIVVTQVQNHAPTATSQTVSTAKNTPAGITLTGHDADGDPLTYAIGTGPSHGTLSGTAPSITYTPTAGYAGPDSLTFTTSDGTATSTPATITISVGGAPVAAFTRSPGGGPAPTTVSFDATESTDLDGRIVSYDWNFGDGTTGSGRTVTHLYANAGTYPITLTVTDDDGLSSGSPDSVIVATVDVASLSVPVCGDQDDLPSLVLQCRDYIWRPGVQTWLVPGAGNVGVTFDFVYRTATYQNQLSVFEVDDAAGTVDGVAPGDPAYGSRALARARNIFEIPSDASTPDVTLPFAGGTRVAFFVSQSTNEQLNSGFFGDPTPRMLFSIVAANTFPFFQALSFDSLVGGPVEFAFEDLVDGGGGANYADVVFTATNLVSPPEANHAPIAVGQTLSTSADTPLPITLTGTDQDSDPLSFTVVSGPLHGTLSGIAPDLTYSPQSGYVGSDSFNFLASDGQANSANAEVTIQVVPLNRRPVANAQLKVTPSNTSLAITLTGSDLDGDVLSFAVLSGPLHGSLSGVAPDLVYMPVTGYSGPDGFRFSVSDGQLTSVAETVSITVGNAPPTANAGGDREVDQQLGSYFFDGQQSFDSDGSIVAYTWHWDDGSADEVNPYGLTAHALSVGVHLVRLTVTDDQGATDEDTITVTVRNVAPTVTSADSRRVPTGLERLYWVDVSDPGGIGDIESVMWDFGDGTTASGTAVNHTYSVPGTFDAIITATDVHGGVGTKHVAVTVRALTADAGADVTVAVGSEVSLGGPNTSSSDPETTILWDFGDGSTSSERLPVHSYVDDGTFTATLRVTDIATNTVVTDTAIVTVTNTPPTIVGIAYIATPEPGELASFRAFATDPGVNDVLSGVWSFGDGGTAVGLSADHVYASAGTYTVSVTVSDGGGGSAMTTRTVRVGPFVGSRDSKGREHWLAFQSNHVGAPELSLFIAGETATSGTVDVPGIGFTASFTVVPGAVTTVVLPAEAMVEASGVFGANQPLAVHVVANDEVTVYGLNRIQYTTDAFLGLPLDVLGTDHFVAAYSGPMPGEIAIVATHNNTTVNLTPVGDLIGAASDPGGPKVFHLDIGDVVQVQGPDLTGSRITSDHPVAVFGGNQCANIPNGFAFCDHITEQMPSTDLLGNRFVTVPLATRLLGDTVRVIATQALTTVTIGGALVATIGVGEFYETVLTQPSLIQTSHPALVVQYSNGRDFDLVTSDPFEMLVPPAEQYLPSYTVSTPSTGFKINFLNIVAPSAALSSLTVDGIVVDPASWMSVPGSTLFGAQVPVSLGSHRVAADVPIGVFVYGFDDYDSYGYPGGFQLARVGAVTDLAVRPSSQSLAIGVEGCVGATVTDGDGVGIADARLDFAIAGPNPATGFVFTDSSGVGTVCWTGGNVGTDTVTVSLGELSRSANIIWSSGTPVNDVPVADSRSVSTDEDVPVGVVLSGSDGDGDVLTFAVVSGPLHGVLSGSGASRTYTPDADFSGPDSFTYRVSDGVADSPVATVSITVRAVNDVPRVDAGSDTEGTEGSAVVLVGASSDTDGGTPRIAWSVVPGADVDSGAACSLSAPTAPTTTLTCTDDGTYTATLTASDGVSPDVFDSATVTLTNASPLVSITSPTDLAVVSVGSIVPLIAPVGDPGSNDRLVCTIDWGDGIVGAGVIDLGTCRGTHQYSTIGVRTLTVTVVDDDGARAVASEMLIVFDQTALITGGGWLTSRDGIRVRTGFVASSTTSGYVGQLQVQTGTSSRFHGATVTTLAISGNSATWAGTGRWNDRSGFTYEVRIVDGGTGRSKRPTPDSFSIIVRNPAGVIVLDVGGPLRGGNLKIH